MKATTQPGRSNRSMFMTLFCLGGICLLLGVFLFWAIRNVNGEQTYLRALIAASFAKATVDFIFDEIGAWRS